MGDAGDVRASGSVALAPSSGAAGSPNSVGPGGLSFDHLIRPLQERRRDRESEGLGGLEVDHQLELRWPFHWQIAWVCTSKDSGDIIPCSTPRLVNACVTQGFPA